VSVKAGQAHIDVASGTLYQAQAETSGMQSYPGTVQLQGTTLVISGGLSYYSGSNPAPDLLGAGQYAAQLNGSSLSVGVPFTDGSVQDYPCSAAPISDYNQDVSEMQSGVQAAQPS
jgi:hypothetical protein